MDTSQHTELFLRSRISSAFRTGWACLIAGIVIELANVHVQWMCFPIFSYIMAITIVTESTFEKALTDVRAIFIGTVQSIGMALLGIQLVHAYRVSLWVAMLFITFSSMIITYPKATDVLSKRVALALTAIIFINAHIQREHMKEVYFPLQLGASTLVGALSALLALTLPVPRLAFCEVYTQARLNARVAYERLRIMVDAFCGDDNPKALCLILQAKALAKIGNAALAELNSKQGQIEFEIPGFSSCKPRMKPVTKGLNGLKQHLLGMELALQYVLNSSSKTYMHGMLKDSLIYLTEWASLALKYACVDKVGSGMGHKQRQIVIAEGEEVLVTFDETLIVARQKLAYLTNGEIEARSRPVLLTARGIVLEMDVGEESKPTFKDLAPAFFFLLILKKFVIEIRRIVVESNEDQRKTKLENSETSVTENTRQKTGNSRAQDSPLSSILPRQLDFNCIGDSSLIAVPKTSCRSCIRQDVGSVESKDETPYGVIWTLWKQMYRLRPEFEQFRTSVKAAMSMAVATFLGSCFNKSHGYWADITVALGFANTQGGSFKIANLRVQGTVAGCIYGFLASLATQNFPYLRLVSLIPWVVFTSFLLRSKTFERAGSMSAFNGAIVVLGRRHKESDEHFTIIRIVESFLGMVSFIIVELIILPRRASSLARNELCFGFASMKDFLAAMLSADFGKECITCCGNTLEVLKVHEKDLRGILAKQVALVKEAIHEPELWSVPFPGAIYSNILDIQGRMMDFIHFVLCSLEEIIKTSANEQIPMEKLLGPLEPALQLVEEKILPSLEFLENVLQLKSFDDKVSIATGSCKTLKRTCSKVADEENQYEEREKKAMGSGQPIAELVTGTAVSDKLRAQKQLQSPTQNTVASRQVLFMDTFENGLQQVGRNLSHNPISNDKSGDTDTEGEVMSNDVVLSLSSLAFSLQGLVKETRELEKAVHELLQSERPWSLIDFWGAARLMGKLWRK